MISYWGVDHGEEVSKIDIGRALKLSSNFGKKGKAPLQRRAFQVAARADRRLGGETARHNQGRTLNDLESSERHGVGRAAKKRGVTAENIDHAIFARSSTGRAGYTNYMDKYKPRNK